jgi:hypothetical protein
MLYLARLLHKVMQNYKKYKKKQILKNTVKLSLSMELHCALKGPTLLLYFTLSNARLFYSV